MQNSPSRAARATFKAAGGFPSSSASAPSSPAKPRTQAFVARGSMPPSEFVTRMQQEQARDAVRPMRSAYSAHVNEDIEREARSSQSMRSIAPATDASRGVGLGIGGSQQQRRSQSDVQQRQASQQQRYSGQLEPPYEDEEPSTSRSFRRTVSASVRSGSRQPAGQRLRQSIFTTDGRLNESSLEDRCANLASNANGVLQFYNAIVQDGVGTTTVEEMTRHWQPFEGE